MSGRMLHVADGTPPQHRCQPPGNSTMLSRMGGIQPGRRVVEATVPPGSIWRCAECGLLWESRPTRSGVFSAFWEPAGPLVRWRYRKAGLT
jgi:hypothetical protein